MIGFLFLGLVLFVIGFIVSAKFTALFIDLVIYFSPILRCHFKNKYAKRNGLLTNVSIKKNGN